MTRPSFSPSLCGMAWGLLLVAGTVVHAEEPQAAGVVRISKPSSAPVVRGQSDGILQTGCKECEMGMGMHGDHTLGHGMYSHSATGYTRKGYSGSDCFDGNCPDGSCNGGKHGAICEYFKCKFGFLFPTGCGGYGCPPIGKYYRVYPQDPSYFDQRDGQAWGAPGYGIPIAVPLAPVVSHQYNYSWGTPASRLTPISRLAPY